MTKKLREEARGSMTVSLTIDVKTPLITGEHPHNQNVLRKKNCEPWLTAEIIR